MKETVKQTPDRRTTRKSYRKPTLVEYGSVTKLTQGTIGSGVDGGTGMPGMMLLGG